MKNQNGEAIVVANIPKNEKTVLGLMTTKQLEIVGSGVCIGFVVFLFIKKVLALFFVPLVTRLVISFAVWCAVIFPFAYNAFMMVKSDGINPVPLYPKYVQRRIKKNSKYEYGTYVNYHINHFKVEHGIHIANETTQIPDASQTK